MLILPQMVDMRWTSKNKVHFETKGCNFTKYND